MLQIPAPPSQKPIAFFDTECYPNFWLLKFRILNGPTFSFSLYAGQRLSSETAGKIARLFGMFTVVSFNGIYYDVPMIAGALSGYSTEELKMLSNKLISEGAKPWQLGLSWKPSDHIDIIETLPGAGSQKMYAGRVHAKTMRDLPYEHFRMLSDHEMIVVDDYCGNDLDVLAFLFHLLRPQLQVREQMGALYNLDLRSKSDAQCAEAIIKYCCEQEIGCRIYKPEINWNMTFKFEVPDWMRFRTPAFAQVLETVRNATFRLGPSGNVVLPEELEGLKIPFGSGVYRIGIGGLHSSEKKVAHFSDEHYVIRDADVASYYPSLIINSGKWPEALGPPFRKVYIYLKTSRLDDKREQGRLEDLGLKGTPEWIIVFGANEGKKVFVNGAFGKTLSSFSILFAPQMGIQTTVGGQLSLLMLVENLELAGIPVISANTDGVVMKCPRALVPLCDSILKQWENTTNLELDKLGEYSAVYSRDVNNYIAIKAGGKGAKRKGEFAKAGLVEKHSPDVEICGDAVTEFLMTGTPILYTIASCRDIRKFVTIQKVSGGAVKLWGAGPRKEYLVRDMTEILQSNGWIKEGRKWRKGDLLTDARSAYKTCFAPQRPEFLGKMIRWYYGVNSPGQIVDNKSGDTVSLSYGAQPCMVLPDELPADIDYDWYLTNCEKMLKNIGYYASV